VPAGPDARTAALGILGLVRDGQTFEEALAAADPLDATDRRLAYEIAAGVLRSRSELDARLAPLVSGSWQHTPEHLKDALRVGAYQLLKLSRVPSYAAVQTTVEAAKGAGGRKGAGLANAVLRRLARERDVVPSPADTDLATRYSHPRWLVERWTSRFGGDATEALLRHNNRRPDLVIQPAARTAAELREALEAAGVSYHEAPWGAGLVVEASPVTDLPGFDEGAFLVQDPAQARLLEFAAIPDGATVWDACAAPGGKAAALGQRCRVVASELKRQRLGRLRDTVTRVPGGVCLLGASKWCWWMLRAPPPAPWGDTPTPAGGSRRRRSAGARHGRRRSSKAWLRWWGPGRSCYI
jgi:16S rRNA (cytosine967-C5)-methyltransferase